MSRRMSVHHFVANLTTRRHDVGQRMSDLLGVSYWRDVPADAEFPRTVNRMDLVQELLELVRYRPQEALAYLEQHPDLATDRLDTEEDPRYGGDHLIHRACGEGRTPILRYLLDRGVDANTRGGGDDTPLHCAAAAHNLDGVRMLLAAGGDPNARDEDGLSPLDRCMENHAEVFKALLDGGAEPRLFPALAQGRTDVVEELVRTLTPAELRAQVWDTNLLPDYAENHADPDAVIELLRQAGFQM